MHVTQLGHFVTPEVVATHFHLKEGDVVADLGAGSGFFLETLAMAVGPTGQVFACEIQKNLVEKLGDMVRSEGLSNVTPLWCDIKEVRGIKLVDGALDAAIMVNVLFQIEEREAVVREIYRTVRTGGVLHLIDWNDSPDGVGPQPQLVITKEEAIDLFESNGFIFERDYPAGDHHYGLAFRTI